MPVNLDRYLLTSMKSEISFQNKTKKVVSFRVDKYLVQEKGKQVFFSSEKPGVCNIGCIYLWGQ